MNIIQCYAPTNDNDQEVNDNFYDRLQSVLENCSTRDVTCLLGDFNAKIDGDNRGYEQIMGRHGLGEMNDNGERFADLCASYNLVIGSSIFPPQTDPQGNLEIARSGDRESDRPHLYLQEVQTDTAGRACQERC